VYFGSIISPLFLDFVPDVMIHDLFLDPVLAITSTACRLAIYWVHGGSMRSRK
jgi:hypothetical protein